jgi:leucyl aminopeptidase
MLNKPLIALSIGLLSSISIAVQATPATDKHVVVAPQCLSKSLTTPYKTLSKKDQLALIEVNNAGIDQLITAKHDAKTPCGGFMDVTHEWKGKNAAEFLSNYAPKAHPLLNGKNARVYGINYQAQVNALIDKITPEDMWNDLTTLSGFKDRYANSDNGVKAANWLKTQIETMAKDNGRTDVTAYLVATGSYKQPSVVVKIGDSNEPGVVVGGHMDTLGSSYENKPGADDDGSGTVSVLGVARTLLTSGMHFSKPIYIIWYAAEEEGLVGSQYVVKDFIKKKIAVSDVIQLDMTGYEYKNDPTIWLINDHVNKPLTSYLEKLVTTYVKQPVKYTTCGYACSDHASWDNAGIAASFPFESSFGNDDPYVHTARDTMEKLSLNHITDYAKLGTAFVVELAQPVAG